MYNTSPNWACIWQESDQRPLNYDVQETVLRSKRWAPLAELLRGKRLLEVTDCVISTGRRVRSMLRYPLVMTPAALSEHQLPQ